MRPFLVLLMSYAVSLAADLVPDGRTAIFAREKAQAFIGDACIKIPEGITGYWTPAMSDLRGVEDGLPEFLEHTRPELAQWLSGKSRDGEDHRSWMRRWVAGASKGEHRYLLISYQCEWPAETAQKEKEIKAKSERMGWPYHPDHWKESPPHVDGGGWRFFRVLFDVRERKFVWYEENFPY